MSLALLLLAILFLLLFIHPYVTYPLSLQFMKKRPLGGAELLPRPTASLLFSAFNEERVLSDKIRNLEEIRRICPDIQFVAYSDMSTDRTKEIILDRSDIVRLVPSTERTGKATGMKRMVASCNTDICIFTDANVLLDPQTVPRLLDYFRDPTVGGVSGTLKYINEDDGATARVGGFYWRLEERIKKLESACGSMMGADGSIFATRRRIYPEVPPHLLDDMTVSMSVTFSGLRLISAPDVVAFEKSTTSSKEEFWRKRRIACRAFNTHRFLWPKIRATYGSGDIYKYVSHKLLRWFGAPVLALSGIFFLAALILAGLQWIALALAIFAVLVLLTGRIVRDGPLSALAEVVTSIVATFLGIIDSWMGKTYQTWAPAKSR